MSHSAALSAQCVTHRASIQPRPQPMPMLTNFGLQPYVAVVYRLMVSTPSSVQLHGLLIIYRTWRDERLSWPTSKQSSLVHIIGQSGLANASEVELVFVCIYT